MRDVEIAIERRQVLAVLEGDIAEADRPRLDRDRLGLGTIRDAERLVHDRDQLFHVVDRALEVAHVHADVAQVALQHEERGQHQRDVARVGLAAGPEQRRPRR